MKDYRGVKAMVCGAARSGIAAAALLKKLGADVTLYDAKNLENFGSRAEIEGLGVKLLFGAEGDVTVGFGLIVLSPGISINAEFVQRALNRGVKVIGEAELAFGVCKAPVIAVTGTNGKTTTVALAGEIIKNYHYGSAVVGNIGTAFSGKVLDIPENAFAVAEISSFQLETADEFRPRVAAILNVTPDHLNRHGSMENYIAEKEKIFARQRASDFAVFNYDDEICRKMAERTAEREDAPTIVFFSAKSPEKNTFKIISREIVPLPGEHNFENALAAAAVAACAKVPGSIIKKVVGAFGGVEHRIEFVAEVGGVAYYNDSKATNADSAIKAVEALERPLLIILGGRDKDIDFAPLIKLFNGRVRRAVLIGEAADKIAKTCEGNGFYEFEFASTLKDAVLRCKAVADAGDAVLLSPACASFDMFESYEHRGRVFKEIVRGLQNGERDARAD